MSASGGGTRRNERYEAPPGHSAGFRVSFQGCRACEGTGLRQVGFLAELCEHCEGSGLRRKDVRLEEPRRTDGPDDPPPRA